MDQQFTIQTNSTFREFYTYLTGMNLQTLSFIIISLKD
ncbi:unnamed protein product [Acanthoscelides obtectus]|uniref:Uncharacterized protein n=1 Tax=Acanthoscelides obtectus TaxID=200917 RepID=A0A9P0LKK9_ACAOB|nr:unnamed protein product [Acanthoscelides obtectus]CAK1663069.1 hypothetical protein AOBTE_LOCUS23468 [Acanthoscelides obtectus]